MSLNSTSIFYVKCTEIKQGLSPEIERDKKETKLEGNKLEKRVKREIVRNYGSKFHIYF